MKAPRKGGLNADTADVIKSRRRDSQDPRMHTDKHAHQKQARRHAQKDNEMLALFAAQGIEAIARSARVYGAPVLPKLLCDATVPHPAVR